MARNGLETLNPVSNGAEETILTEAPYTVEAELTGTADLLFHAWNVEAVEAKAKAHKGSKAKKTDDVQSYVYRNDDNMICVPSEYVRMSIINAAKFSQDPRSPRKSAMDLFKAALICDPKYCSLGKSDWDYIDQRRVVVQRNGITRHRPAFVPGWKIKLQITVGLPQYISPDFLQDRLTAAGKLIGLGDFRPTYGRYAVTSYSILQH